MLNRIIRWTNEGIEYEADPRQVEIILKQMDMQDSKPVVTLGTKDEGTLKSGDGEGKEVGSDQPESRRSTYRAIVAGANYLPPDRPDISFAVKELARAMSSPKLGDWERLERLARYLKGRPRVVKKFRWQSCTDVLTIFTDADWVGDKVSRKSTSGGCIMVGKHMIKGWSKHNPS